MSVCFALVSSDEYQKFISLFAYTCFKVYPQSGIRILLLNTLKKEYNELIKKLKGDIVIKENCFKNFTSNTSSYEHELESLRWIIDKQVFSGYENGYIGDIDLIICGEPISLEEQHLEHCKQNNLPYSNSIRSELGEDLVVKAAHPDFNNDKMSGLHFIKVNEYYKAIENVRRIYEKKLKNKEFKFSTGAFCNEHVLYNMIKDSDLKFSKGWFAPHHGLHIGYWRHGTKGFIKNRYMGLDNYKQYYDYYIKNFKDDVFFKEIINEIKITNQINSMQECFDRNYVK